RVPRSASRTTWAARARSGASPCSPTASEGIPMDFGFSEEQEMLRKSARDFLAKECPMTYVRQMMEDERGFRDEPWQKMAALGWMGLILPEEHGGAGLDFVHLTVVLEEMGRVVLPGPFFSTVVLGGVALLEGGSAAQKKELLPKLAAGKLRLTLAQLEPSARWDAEGVTLEARPAGGGYQLSGTKLFVPDAHTADLLIVAARGPGSQGAEGVSLFLVDAKAPGVTTTLLKTMDQTRKLCEVVLHDVPEASLAAAMAKAYCSDAYRHTAGEGIQIHGGIGFTWEHDMHIYFKRAKSSEVTFGDATWNREIVAQLIGL